jgi:predicted ATPase
VVDNLEHLLPEAAGALAELVAAAPTLRLIVTSREALRIQGEEQLDLPPLVEAEAAALFLSRAHAVQPELEHTPAVDELCRRLDCLPLALELAAARTKLLTPEALLERLGARLDLLRGTRDADPRHATLRATIAWSFDLLTQQEQDLFARLSVFAAGCTLESAEAVCGAGLTPLESLLDKSLIRRRVGSQGEERLWMLETIREFAAERLQEHLDVDVIRRNHCARMLAIARSAHLEDDGSSQPQQHGIVLAELADIRLALDWAAAHDVVLGIELNVALESHWAATHPEEGARRIGDLLSRADAVPPELRAAALRQQGGALYRSGDFESGRRLHEESLAAFRDVGDERGAANLLARIAVDAAYFGDPDRARSLAEEVVELGRALDMPRLQAEGLGALASIQRRAKDFEAALSLARRSADAARDCGFLWWQSNMLAEILELSLLLGRLDEAEHAGRAALRLATPMDDRLVRLWAVTGLALIEQERGDLARAGRLWGAVDSEVARDPPPQAGSLEEFAAPLAVLSDPRFVLGHAEGRELALEDAIALALGEDQTLP